MLTYYPCIKSYNILPHWENPEKQLENQNFVKINICWLQRTANVAENLTKEMGIYQT